ncbi:MAG: peptidase inhibitor family I36 protein [Acidobacteriota bacterium]|nr:peptidase inhibitor family I36 protein [Blastocatellia bacterium]MDW8240790.1 peptidase inhibitor family I36 protein [Acidobacteriota bacterium]
MRSWDQITLALALGCLVLPAASLVPLTRAQADRVCVYGDKNFKGKSECWSGSEDLPDLRRLGWNDMISSIRVFGRARVVIYKDVNFGGESLEVASDVSDLKNLPGNWNDQISSLRIVGSGYGGFNQGGGYNPRDNVLPGQGASQLRGHGVFQLQGRRNVNLQTAVVELAADGDALLEFRGDDTLRFYGRWRRVGSNVDLDLKQADDRRRVTGDGRIEYRRGQIAQITLNGRSEPWGDPFRLSFSVHGTSDDQSEQWRRSEYMTWRGRVDDEIEIFVRGDEVRVRTIAGRPLQGERVSFSSPLPRRDIRVELRQIRGRGSVEIIQQPERFNNYTAVVRIRDKRGGDDEYEFELSW